MHLSSLNTASKAGLKTNFVNLAHLLRLIISIHTLFNMNYMHNLFIFIYLLDCALMLLMILRPNL